MIRQKIANEFNKLYANIVIELASTIPTAKTTFKTYVKFVNSAKESNPLSINEFKDAFFSLRIHKSSDYDEISFTLLRIDLSNYMIL